jgi:hypothetical protein
VRDVVDAHVEQDVGVSRGREALFDLLVLERRLHDPLRIGVTGDLQLGERLERRAEPAVVEHDRVAGDDPEPLEALDSPLGRRCREVHARGELGHRAAPVAAQQVEDLQVDRVQPDGFLHELTLRAT